MNLLFIGGTRFVGQAMAREALDRGHKITLFHRGKTSAHGLPGATQLLGDRSADLSALAQGHWDAVIDTCGYRPGEIHAVADALGGRAGQYVFVSSVSVYADDIAHDSDESAARKPTSALDPATLDTVAITGDTYGPLKVLCEDAVLARDPHAMVIRPTYVIGPDDYTPRFPQWVRRIAAGGVVPAPGPRDAAVQYIDARDLATFVISAVEQGLQGAFNLATPRVPFGFGALLEGIAAGVAPTSLRFDWLEPAAARASGLDFPLWHGGESSGVAAVNCDRARSHGLRGRPLADTAADVLSWIRQRDAAGAAP